MSDLKMYVDMLKKRNVRHQVHSAYCHTPKVIDGVTVAKEGDILQYVTIDVSRSMTEMKEIDHVFNQDTGEFIDVIWTHDKTEAEKE